MKKQFIIIPFLFLSINSFSQKDSIRYRGNIGESSLGVEKSLKEPYTLTGRKAVKKPVPKITNCKDFGRIIMEIIVDKKGNVLEAKLGRGSTTNSSCLVEASKEAALKTKWNKDKNAVDKQNGKIIYYFKKE